MQPFQLKIVKFRCRICRKQFQSKDELNKHLKKNKACRQKVAKRIARSRLERPCPVCGKVITRGESLKLHIRTIHQDPSKWKFKCNLCEQLFPTKLYRDRHQKRHEVKLANQHLQRPRKKKPLKDGTKPVTSEYKCDICGGKYASRKSLRVHMQHLHKRKEDYTDKCNECGEMFPSPALLKRHLVKHVEIEGLSSNATECPKCGRSFASNYALRFHLYSKACDGTFKCDQCGQHFQDASGVSTHKRFGCNNFKCPYCLEPFLIRSQLGDHIRQVHSFNVKRNHACSECGKEFPYQSKLKRHTSQVHKPKDKLIINRNTLVTCGICLRRTRGYLLFMHVLKCHESLIKQNDPRALDSMTDCGICGIKVAAKLYAAHVHVDLDNHYRYHTNRILTDCTLCSFKARKRSLLMLHRMAHEQSRENWIKATTCTDCRKVSSFFDLPEGKHNNNCKQLIIIQKNQKKELNETKAMIKKAQEEGRTGGVTQYCCRKCNVVDESRIGMQQHNVEAHKIGISNGVTDSTRDGAFRCFICNKGWSRREDCLSHLDLCMDTYATEDLPQEKNPQPVGPGELALYCCGTCDAVEPSRIQMQQHNEEEHKIGIAPGVKDSSKDGTFKCFICNKGWPSQEHCRLHLELLCMDMYATKELPLQKKTTQGFPVYFCGVCEYTDQSRKSMELHNAKKHGVFILSIDVLPEGSNEGNYLCFICGEGYPSSGECRRHLIVCMKKHSTKSNDVILGDRLCELNPHKWGVVEYKLEKKEKIPVACFPLNRVINLKNFM